MSFDTRMWPLYEFMTKVASSDGSLGVLLAASLQLVQQICANEDKKNCEQSVAQGIGEILEYVEKINDIRKGIDYLIERETAERFSPELNYQYQPRIRDELLFDFILNDKTELSIGIDSQDFIEHLKGKILKIRNNVFITTDYEWPFELTILPDCSEVEFKRSFIKKNDNRALVLTINKYTRKYEKTEHHSSPRRQPGYEWVLDSIHPPMIEVDSNLGKYLIDINFNPSELELFEKNDKIKLKIKNQKNLKFVIKKIDEREFDICTLYITLP